MGQYDFTYEIPDGFHDRLVRFLQQNGSSDIAQILRQCKVEYEDMGLAYYAGMQGDNWDKKALDFTLEGTEKNVRLLRPRNQVLTDAIRKLLKPSTTGYLIRKIDYVISDDDLQIFLPEERGESFDILSRDIYDALGKNEPTLVLDRLHTYTTRFFRDMCRRHSIPIADDTGDNYPLHSLAGSLAKYYREKKVFESDFVEQTLKMSISTFEKYNAIRNNKSYAHDNEVLNKAEATYVVTIITATLPIK